MILNPVVKFGGRSSKQWCSLFTQSTKARRFIFPKIAGESPANVALYVSTGGISQKHQASCPVSRAKATTRRLGSESGSKNTLIRLERGGKCRLAFLPAEWFEFFHVITGVSGGYILLLNFVNYCVSKEIYVMEHEYYCGLSIAIMVYYATTRAGPPLAVALDKDVDAIVEEWEKGRVEEKAMLNKIITDATNAQRCAEGQKHLMDAKKENVQMQLEAIYRERCMLAYKAVKGRMDYHLRVYLAEARIHQKWMVEWILKNVMKSISPQFEQEALNQAIKEIEAVASRA